MDNALLLSTVCAGLLLFGVPALVRRYVGRLPEAPECPGCFAVTRMAEGGWLPSFLHRRFPITAVRECTRCGWRGRMRWRWAPRRVQGR